jgi:hypothetical protein
MLLRFGPRSLFMPSLASTAELCCSSVNRPAPIHRALDSLAIDENPTAPLFPRRAPDVSCQGPASCLKCRGPNDPTSELTQIGQPEVKA